jgi:photoactive yellow protein
MENDAPLDTFSSSGARLTPACGGPFWWPMDFTDPDIAHALEACDNARLDTLDFGVIRMTLDGLVDGYNTAESRLAGLDPSRVLGKNFFTEVAPCTNNYLVASRFEDCPSLDERLPYVFTLRMRPRNVELRLVKAPSATHQYVLVRSR